MTGRRRSGAAAQAIARDAGHVAGAGEFPQSWHEREVRERIEAVLAASRRRAEADGHVSNWAEVNWNGPDLACRAPWPDRERARAYVFDGIEGVIHAHCVVSFPVFLPRVLVSNILRTLLAHDFRT